MALIEQDGRWVVNILEIGMNRNFRAVFSVLLACASLLVAKASEATLVAYASHAAFANELARLQLLNGDLAVLREDFDEISAGGIIDSIGKGGVWYDGLGFRYELNTVRMAVSTGYTSTSAPNFLGTTDANIFQSGDNFETLFRDGSNAVGMDFISADLLFSGDIEIRLRPTQFRPEFIAALDGSSYTRLSDGSYAYFLGIVESDLGAGFSSASVWTDINGGGNFLYNVDNITTTRLPEPSTLSVVVLGLLFMVFKAVWGRVQPCLLRGECKCTA